MEWEVQWAFIQGIFSLILEDDHVGGLGDVREWYLTGEHLGGVINMLVILGTRMVIGIYLPDDAAEGVNVTTRCRCRFRLFQIRVDK